MIGYPESMATRDNEEQVFFRIYNRADKYAKKAREKSLTWLDNHRTNSIENRLERAIHKLVYDK